MGAGSSRVILLFVKSSSSSNPRLDSHGFPIRKRNLKKINFVANLFPSVSALPSMNTDRESQIRERMTSHWLTSENAIRAYIAGAVRSFTDREDLLQQVALTVARRFEEFDESRPFLAWALWLAKSRIIDFYRSQGRQPQMLDDNLLDKYAEALTERQQAVPAQREALERCLEELPDRSRTLVGMKYHDGLKIDQIAEAIRSTPASVRVTLFRIRDALANCIKRRLASEAIE
jgi:RNA polymerase sigma-70 factor (ECF subfamily)